MIVQCAKCKKRYLPAEGKQNYFLATNGSTHNGRCWNCLTPAERDQIRAKIERPTYSE